MSSLTRLIAASGLALAGLVGGAEAQTPQPGSCLFTQFKTKSPGCTDQVLALSSGLSSGTFNVGMPPIGYLAETFLRSPTERARILAAPGDKGAVVFVLAGLLRAGLTEDAERFAAATESGSLLQRLKAMRLLTLSDITEAGFTTAKDYEFLAGAYGASGNRRYLDLILTTFNGIDEKSAALGLRLGLLTVKWGANAAPAGHPSKILRNLCGQIDCKVNPIEAQRILGLVAAYGAVSTIARADAGTKKLLDASIGKHKALKAILAKEQAYLSNYVAALTVSRILTGGPGENVAAREAALRSIETYESFGPLPQALPGAATAEARP
ncbi:hypothetical protein [Methylorubrum sp. SB2]|uniref:hypothetical protein n=1 Tax=Methylorubrum subtropicum TaxID=3138812 RepID=UPI00313DFC9C